MDNLSRVFQKQSKINLKRLSFITQFKIQFLLLFTSCKKSAWKNVCHQSFKKFYFSITVPFYLATLHISVNFDYLPLRGGGIWKIKKRGWKFGARAGLLKRRGVDTFPI